MKWRFGVESVYEGNNRVVRTIHPQSVISSASYDFITDIGPQETKVVVFREDIFAPVTRIRR